MKKIILIFTLIICMSQAVYSAEVDIHEDKSNFFIDFYKNAVDFFNPLKTPAELEEMPQGSTYIEAKSKSNDIMFLIEEKKGTKKYNIIEEESNINEYNEMGLTTNIKAFKLGSNDTVYITGPSYKQLPKSENKQFEIVYVITHTTDDTTSYYSNDFKLIKLYSDNVYSTVSEAKILVQSVGNFDVVKVSGFNTTELAKYTLAINYNKNRSDGENIETADYQNIKNEDELALAFSFDTLPISQNQSPKYIMSYPIKSKDITTGINRFNFIVLATSLDGEKSLEISNKDLNVYTQETTININGQSLSSRLSSFLMNEIAPSILQVGNLMFIIITIILGIKYVWVASNEKAQIKEGLINLAVAAIFLFMSDVVYGLTTGGITEIVFAEEINSIEDVLGNIYANIYLIVQWTCILAIMFIGLKYMMSNPDKKSKIKTNYIMIIIGISMVLCTSTVIEFFVKSAGELLP